MRSRLSILTLVAALALVALLPFANATTAPAVSVTIQVIVTDSSLTMDRYKARRGWAVHFVVRNRGTKPHAVDIGGLQTGVIAPGRKKTVSASLEERGSYPYKVVGGAVTKQSGVFRVF